MRTVVPAMTVNAHLDQATGLTHTLFSACAGSASPWVALKVGDRSDGVSLFVHDLGVLTALGDLVDRARQDLARELSVLPNGEPCAYADVFGSWDWNEHDHDQCLEVLVDEPVPYVPAKSAPTAGTAWERHDDPTVEDNPLDDGDADDLQDDEDDEDDEDDDGIGGPPGKSILRAEGWL